MSLKFTNYASRSGALFNWHTRVGSQDSYFRSEIFAISADYFFPGLLRKSFRLFTAMRPQDSTMHVSRNCFTKTVLGNNYSVEESFILLDLSAAIRKISDKANKNNVRYRVQKNTREQIKPAKIKSRCGLNCRDEHLLL